MFRKNHIQFQGGKQNNYNYPKFTPAAWHISYSVQRVTHLSTMTMLQLCIKYAPNYLQTLTCSALHVGLEVFLDARIPNVVASFALMLPLYTNNT